MTKKFYIKCLYIIILYNFVDYYSYFIKLIFNVDKINKINLYFKKTLIILIKFLTLFVKIFISLFYSRLLFL